MSPGLSDTRSDADFSMSQASVTPPRQQRQRYLPPRRPPMNPLISRLRSTSGMFSTSRSTSFRSVSHTSSINSLRDIEGLNGFANSSPNSSFLMEAGRNAVQNGPGSRSSLNGDVLSPILRSDVFASDIGETEAGQARLPVDEPLAGTKNAERPSTPLPPVMEPFKWTALRRLSQTLHPTRARDSIVGGKLGAITAMTASGIICVGTSAGWTIVFDYSQTLKCVCGNEEIATSAGKVTSLALSSDQTFAAVGHESGFIYIYAFAKPQIPARVVPPVTLQAVQQGKAEGHLAASGNVQSAIIQLGFVGSRHTAIVSADSRGLAFYHSLGKVLGLANTDVLRILGRYPQDLASSGLDASSILAMQALPLGTQAHATDEYALVAILTPSKLVVAGLKPSAKTWFRALNVKYTAPKNVNSQSANFLPGALAWLPSIDGRDPRLAYTWDDALHIVRVQHEVLRSTQMSKSNGQRGPKETVTKALRFQLEGPRNDELAKHDKASQATFMASAFIAAMQWYNHRVCRPILTRATRRTAANRNCRVWLACL